MALELQQYEIQIPRIILGRNSGLTFVGGGGLQPKKKTEKKNRKKKQPQILNLRSVRFFRYFRVFCFCFGFLWYFFGFFRSELRQEIPVIQKSCQQ